jgi:GNAT superfamily N-acetyltransferase
MYSDWHGRRILFLEDLFILPEHRSRSYGSLFFQNMSQVADTKGMKLAWEVNRDNFNQRAFFESKGAVNRTHKVGFFMGGDALTRQASHYLDHRVEINQQEENEREIN